MGKGKKGKGADQILEGSYFNLPHSLTTGLIRESHQLSPMGINNAVMLVSALALFKALCHLSHCVPSSLSTQQPGGNILHFQLRPGQTGLDRPSHAEWLCLPPVQDNLSMVCRVAGWKPQRKQSMNPLLTLFDLLPCRRIPLTVELCQNSPSLNK